MAPERRVFAISVWVVLFARAATELLIARTQGSSYDLVYHVGHILDVTLAALLFGRALATGSRLAMVGAVTVTAVIIVRDLGHLVDLPAAQHLDGFRGLGLALGTAALLWELGHPTRPSHAIVGPRGPHADGHPPPATRSPGLVLGLAGCVAMGLGAFIAFPHGFTATAAGLVAAALGGVWIGGATTAPATSTDTYGPTLSAHWSRLIETGATIGWATLIATFLGGMVAGQQGATLSATLGGVGLASAHVPFALGAWRAATQQRSSAFGAAFFLCTWVALFTYVDVLATLVPWDEVRPLVAHARVLGSGFAIAALALALWALAPSDTEGRGQGVTLAVGGLVIALLAIAGVTVFADSKGLQAGTGLALWILLSVCYRRLGRLSRRVSDRLVTHGAAAAFGSEPDPLVGTPAHAADAQAAVPPERTP